MRKLAYVTLDVFTARPLQGNQLAVFLDGRGLGDSEMQALAKEMNFSETTFILPRAADLERTEGIHVRIFTVKQELPFAGHPTLGTAMVLHERRGEPEINLRLQVGKVPVRFSQRNGMSFGVMTQPDPEFGAVHEREKIARAVGLKPEDLAADWPAQFVSTGNPMIIIPVRTLETMQALPRYFNWSTAAEYLKQANARFCYFVCRETTSKGTQLHARMLFYNGEDPATGSAAGPCIAWAVKYGVLAADTEAVIEQGIEMGRASYLFVRASQNADRIFDVRVGGHAVKVMQGELTLP